MLEPLMIRIAALCTPDRVRRYPATVALVFFLVWAGMHMASRQSAIIDGGGKFLGNDFVAFYTGARLWMDGRLHHLYDFEAQRVFQQSLSPVALENFTPFINPPWAVLVYAPFSLSSYLVGILSWWAFGFLCIGAAIMAMRRAHPELAARPWWHLWAIAVCMPATLLWLGYGQVSPLILAILSIAWATLVGGREFIAGLLLSMLAFKPQLAMGLALPLIIKMRWRALAGGVTGLLLWGALAIWLFGDQTLEWWGLRSQLAELLRDESYQRWGVHSLFGFSNLLLADVSKPAADGLTLALSLGWLGWLGRCWWRMPWEPGSREWKMTMAAGLAGAPLLAVQWFSYDLMLLLLPLWIVMATSKFTPGRYLDEGPILGWSGVLFWVIFISGPLLKGILDALTAAGLPAVAIQPVTLLVIAWCVTVHEAKRPLR